MVGLGPGLGKSIEHTVGKLGRSKYFVVGKIGYAGENIGVASAKGEARLLGHMASFSPLCESEDASSRTVIGGYDLMGVKISCLPR